MEEVRDLRVDAGEGDDVAADVEVGAVGLVVDGEAAAGRRRLVVVAEAGAGGVVEDEVGRGVGG